ncbi:hypothetical protein [Luteolibacter pohnpeiensis]|nr:hypothetical protein [Luteolibacter pohnpeiensis]
MLYTMGGGMLWLYFKDGILKGFALLIFALILFVVVFGAVALAVRLILGPFRSSKDKSSPEN